MEVLQGEIVSDARPLPIARRLRLAMLTPTRPGCGIADTTANLIEALREHIEVAWVADPTDFHPAMNDADVVHVQHQYFLFGGVAPWKATFARLAARITAPIVLTVHEFVKPTGSALRRAAIGRSNKAHFAHPAISRWITHTEQDRERLAAMGLSAERIDVIPLPVAARPLLPPATEARVALGLTDRFVITMVGYLSQRKGHRIAFQAMRQLPDTAMLVLAGGRHPDDNSGYADQIAREARELGVADRVRITGFLPHDSLLQHVAATDLVIAPYLDGSASASLGLALAAYRPVIASAIASHVEMVRRVPGAMALAPVGDAGALGEAIAAVMRDRRALTRMVEGSKRYAAAHSVGAAAAHTIDAYRKACEAGARCG